MLSKERRDLIETVLKDYDEGKFFDSHERYDLVFSLLLELYKEYQRLFQKADVDEKRVHRVRQLMNDSFLFSRIKERSGVTFVGFEEEFDAWSTHIENQDKNFQIMFEDFDSDTDYYEERRV